MLFDDGFVKILKGHRMVKANPDSMQSSPLFQPATGTKQDRRDKKRKLNVAALFTKRMKMGSPADRKPASPPCKTPDLPNSSSPVPEDPDKWLPRWLELLKFVFE